MSHTVSGAITRDPKIQAGTNNKGSYTAFFFEVSEFIKGYGEAEDTYTNYSVAFFPKSQAAIDFHMKAIAKGSFVVITCDKLRIDISNTQYPKLKMENARLEGFLNPNQGAQQAPTQQQPAPQYQQQAPAPQQAPQYQQPAPTQQAPQQQAPTSWGNAPQQQAPQQPPIPQQPATQQGQQQAQSQQAPMDFDDDIPF